MRSCARASHLARRCRAAAGATLLASLESELSDSASLRYLRPARLRLATVRRLANPCLPAKKEKNGTPERVFRFFGVIAVILIQGLIKNMFFYFCQNRLFNIDRFFEKPFDRKRRIKGDLYSILCKNISFQSIRFAACRQSNSCAIRK